MEGVRNEAADSLGKVFNAVWRKLGDKLLVDRADDAYGNATIFHYATLLHVATELH